jgi:MFS family permease
MGAASGGRLALRWQALAALSLTVVFSWVERSGMSFLLPDIGRAFGWDVAEVGSHGSVLFSVFFVGYGLSLISLSGAAQRFGPIASLYVVVTASAAVTIATGVGAAFFGSSSFPLMVGLRFALGVTEGVHIPMIAVLVREWFPLTERSRANAVFVSATIVANVLAPLVVIPGVLRLGWTTIIIALGASSLLSIPLLWMVGRNSAVLTAAAPVTNVDAEASPIPLTVRLRVILPWLMFLGVCNNLSAYSLFSWLPAYLDYASHGRAGDSLAFELMIPNAACAIGLAGWAWLGDYAGRKLVISAVGFAILGVFVWLSTLTTSIPGIVSLLSVALMGLMAHAAQETALIQRISTAGSIGRIIGWYNGIGMLVGGSAGTFAVGRLVEMTKRYDLAMLVIVPVALLGAAASLRISRRLAY